jgi:hypothetical protein
MTARQRPETTALTGRDAYGMPKSQPALNPTGGALSWGETVALLARAKDIAGNVSGVMELLQSRTPEHPGLSAAAAAHHHLLKLVTEFESSLSAGEHQVSTPRVQQLSAKAGI